MQVLGPIAQLRRAGRPLSILQLVVAVNAQCGELSTMAKSTRVRAATQRTGQGRQRRSRGAWHSTGGGALTQRAQARGAGGAREGVAVDRVWRGRAPTIKKETPFARV